MKNKGGLFSKVLIGIIFAQITIFTIACLIIFIKTGGNEPSTLITCFFAWFGIEGGALAWIKTSKTKNQKKEIEDNDKPDDYI